MWKGVAARNGLKKSIGVPQIPKYSHPSILVHGDLTLTKFQPLLAPPVSSRA